MTEKHRYISTSFWDDEWIQMLDPSEKLLYLYLMTNPLTNIAGIYEISIRRICFDTGFNSDTVNYILQKFEKAGKIYYTEGWIILPNWPKHQKIGAKDNIRKGIDEILKSLPDDIFYFVIEHGYTYQYIDAIGRPLQAPHKPLISSSKYSNFNSNFNSNSNINTKTPTAADAPAAQPLDNNTELYNKIKKTFEAVHGAFANYGKEGMAIKRIIRLTKGDELAIGLMLKKYHELTESGNAFWAKQPYTPSALLALWDRVKAEGRADVEIDDVAWVEGI